MMLTLKSSYQMKRNAHSIWHSQALEVSILSKGETLAWRIVETSSALGLSADDAVYLPSNASLLSVAIRLSVSKTNKNEANTDRMIAGYEIWRENGHSCIAVSVAPCPAMYAAPAHMALWKKKTGANNLRCS